MLYNKKIAIVFDITASVYEDEGTCYNVLWSKHTCISSFCLLPYTLIYLPCTLIYEFTSRPTCMVLSRRSVLSSLVTLQLTLYLVITSFYFVITIFYLVIMTFLKSRITTFLKSRVTTFCLLITTFVLVIKTFYFVITPFFKSRNQTTFFFLKILFN